MARRDPRGRAVRRRPRRRLRVPDRDDVPGRPAPAPGSSRSRSPSATGGSGRARCRGGSSSRRWSSSSSSGPRSWRPIARRRRVVTDRWRPSPASRRLGRGPATRADARPSRASATSRVAGRAGRDGRAAAPGAGPRAVDGGLSRRPARGVRCRPAAGRVVRVPACGATSTTRRARFEHLDVVGRRLLPPTRLLRSAALTVDPFLLRGASLGAAWRAERSGAAGAVYHAAGPGRSRSPRACRPSSRCSTSRRGSCPARSSAAAAPRFGQRLRAQLLRDAAAVIVGDRSGRAVRPARSCTSGATGSGSCRSRRGRRSRSAVEVRGGQRPPTRPRRERLGLAERYLVYPGRYDVRQDLRHAPAGARRAGRGRPTRRTSPTTSTWPPRILLVGASPDDRAALARAAARQGVGEQPRLRPALPPAPSAALVRGARARHPAGRLRGERASRRSRRSPAGRRSSPRRSGRCPRSSARPGSSSSRATRSGWRSRCATAWTDDRGARADRARAPASGRRWRAPDVGRRRARDPGDLRRGRHRRGPPDGASGRALGRRATPIGTAVRGAAPCRP